MKAQADKMMSTQHFMKLTLQLQKILFSPYLFKKFLPVVLLKRSHPKKAA